MKQIICLALAIAIMSCNKQKAENKDRFVIAGKVENAKSKLIEINAAEYTGLNNFTTPIKENGTFHTAIPVYHYHDIHLIIDNNWINLLNRPGDSVYITIYDNDSLIFSGDNNKTNKDVHELLKHFGSRYRKAGFYNKKSNLNPVEFKHFTHSFYTENKQFLDDVSKSINATNDASTFVQAKLMYKCTDNLFEYGKQHEEKLDSNYYDFISEYQFTQGNANICSEYYSDFINNYFVYKINNDPDYKPVIRAFKRGKIPEGVINYLKLIESKGSNETSDIMVSQFLFQLSKSKPALADSLYSKYAYIISDDLLKSSIQIALDNHLNGEKSLKSLSELAQYEIIGPLFSDLKDNHPDKVLYVDFWGTWCKWCIKEFPHSRELHKDLSDKNVEFVYLCSPTDSADWKGAIEKYNITGTNILLTKDQYTLIQSIFNFSGLPRYMIVNKNGEIVDENAERPSSETLKQQLIELSAI